MTSNKKELLKEACECKDKEVKESKIDNSMDEIEAKRTRVEKIESIFSDINYKTRDDRDHAILAFTKSALTIEEVETLARPLKPGYLSSKDEQVHRKGVY